MKYIDEQTQAQLLDMNEVIFRKSFASFFRE